MSYGVFDELKSCAPKFRFELNRDHRKRMKLKHDGASREISCGKISDFPATVYTFMHAAFPRDPGEQAPTQTFDGETPSLRPRGNLPPRVFLLRSCSSIPTGRCRQATPRKQQQQQHDGVAHGSRAIHRGQGFPLNRSWVTPLSLTIPPATRIRERGGIYPNISRIYPRKNSR